MFGISSASSPHPEAVIHLGVPQPWPLEAVLPLVTLNPAQRLALGRKGRVALGADADLLLFGPRDLALRWAHLICCAAALISRTELQTLDRMSAPHRDTLRLRAALQFGRLAGRENPLTLTC